MNRKSIVVVTFTAMVFALGALILHTPKLAMAETVPQGYTTADIQKGALLYDKWFKVLDVEISGNHPLYPSEAKKSGGDTWRCKECHGWDYIGKDGRYKKGSHFTGIDGLYSARTKSPQQLYDILTDKSSAHTINSLASSSDSVWALVKFIREGQIEISNALNSDGTARGDVGNGNQLAKRLCTMCHGKDGNKIDFKKDKDGLQGVGWLANDNPQETLHKIRWGHPRSAMPSSVADKNLSDAATVDILTYYLTLK